jgi:pilus assembly protein FimV
MFAVAAGAATGGVLNALGEGLDDLDLNLNSDLLESADAGSSNKDSGQELDLADEISEMDLGDLSDLDEVDSESLESSLSLDSEFLNNLEADQQPDAGETKAGSGALDVDLDILDDARDSFGLTGEDNLDLSSTLDGLSELSGLDLSEPSENTNVVGIEDSESLDDLDLESLEKELELLSEDLEDEVVEVPVADEMDVSEKIDTEDEVLDLDSTDEVTTKLDLARAYVDMGDEEGAKSILGEVVKEGSDDQKQQAQELLGSISS